MTVLFLLLISCMQHTNELHWNDLQGAWEQDTEKPLGFVILHDKHVIVIAYPKGGRPHNVSGMRFDKIKSIGDEVHCISRTPLAEKRMTWSRSSKDGRELLHKKFVVEPVDGKGFSTNMTYVKKNTMDYRSIISQILKSKNPKVQDFERQVLESWMKASLEFDS